MAATAFPADASGPVWGVVLAAGRSARMGEPKPLLRVGAETFIEHAVRTLRDGGCSAVVAVVGDDAERTTRLADLTGATVVRNGEPASEQIDSLRLALDHIAEDAAAVAVLPVDHPTVGAGTVQALLDAFRRTGRPIVRPVAHGTPGHPTIFARSVFAELRGPLPLGARSVVAADPARVLDVEVSDDGVALDVNTPADYRRMEP